MEDLQAFELYEGLSQDDFTKLKVFIKNLKAKDKHPASSVISEQQEVSIDEEAKRIKNQQIPIVHQTLIGLSKEDVNEALLKLVNINPWLLIEYIE